MTTQALMLQSKDIFYGGAAADDTTGRHKARWPYPPKIIVHASHIFLPFRPSLAALMTCDVARS